MDINGASAIVTGAASGIGAAVARQLAAAGAKVVVADLQADKGEALAQEIGGAFVSVDVTDTEQIKAAVRKAVELGPLRVLVNSAGIGWAQRTIGKDGAFDSAHDLDAFKKVISINLIGTFDAVRLAATEMSKLDPTETGERGAIVNMASVAAFDGQIGQAAYSAATTASSATTRRTPSRCAAQTRRGSPSGRGPGSRSRLTRKSRWLSTTWSSTSRAVQPSQELGAVQSPAASTTAEKRSAASRKKLMPPASGRDRRRLLKESDT